MPVGWRRDASGSYPQATPPIKWSATENVVWKQGMPGRSYGSPILVGEFIFVASDPAELLCLRAATGEILWRRTNSTAEVLGPQRAQQVLADWEALNGRKKEIQRELNELKKAKPDAKEEHEPLAAQLAAFDKQLDEMRRSNPVPAERGSGNTAATPVSDGKHVYAIFGSGIVASYTLQGEPRWIKFVEGSVIGFGHSASPVLIEDKLIVHLHDLVALNAATGENVWRTELPTRHATPIAVRWGDVDAIVSPAGSVVRASDGKVLLSEPELRVAEGSSIAHDGVVYSQGGKTTAFRLPTSSDATEMERLWETNTARGRRTPSPALHGTLLYGATTEGILEVIDTQAGKIAYRKRLGLDGNLYSSVTAAGDYIYLSSTQGTTAVLMAGPEYQEVARNELESLGSNPIFAGKRMYIRGHKNLYCIGE